MIECAFCDNAANIIDNDLEMWLCKSHFNEMNNIVEMEIEMEEF